MIGKIIVNTFLSFWVVLITSIIPALALYMLLYAFVVRIEPVHYFVMVISLDLLIAIYWGYNLSIYDEFDEVMDILDGIKEEDNHV